MKIKNKSSVPEENIRIDPQAAGNTQLNNIKKSLKRKRADISKSDENKNPEKYVNLEKNNKKFPSTSSTPDTISNKIRYNLIRLPPNNPRIATKKVANTQLNNIKKSRKSKHSDISKSGNVKLVD